MTKTIVISFSPEEFRDMLGIEDERLIEAVYVSFSPMMNEWSFIIDFVEDEDE